jgi:predicted metal-binding protein
MSDSLKSYPPTWKGDLLLACRKCQKKLKDEPGMRALAKLKKTIKRHNMKHLNIVALHVLSVPCMNLCPKRAITVCLPTIQAAGLSVLRNEDEIDALYRRR